jgi:predicted N-acyltransferase
MESEKRGSPSEPDAPRAGSHTLPAQSENDYVTRVLTTPAEVPRAGWNALLALENDPSPFMRHEYLAALHDSGCASDRTGWQARFLTLWSDDRLQAACPVYLKRHSWGEYVFDWAWAQAHEQHGLNYYPKALVAVPYTPVPGVRLLARDANARATLLQALLRWVQAQGLSSLHLLFAQDRDLRACEDAGLMLRHTVQFHWHNGPGTGHTDFDAFLGSLQQEKRKKIRQERRKVDSAGVRTRWMRGRDISEADWDFFYRCYAQTYREHGNPPYLNPDFFARVARDMPDHWLLFMASRDDRPIACSLIGLDPEHRVAYGRYWGAMERVDCLHFELCYYQPIQWCIAQGYQRFEGGAQGEHKMARALLPVRTSSAHWLAHPAFADAVERFLDREAQGMGHYLDALERRSPLRRPGGDTM